MEKIEIKNKNKTNKLAWILTVLFGLVFIFSFLNGESIHEKAVTEEEMQNYNSSEIR